MKSIPLLLLLSLATGLYAADGAARASAPQKSAAVSYLITNDDLPSKVGVDAATFFTIASGGQLQNPNRISLGGSGAGGGYFTAARVSVLQSSTQSCAFLSVSGAAEVAAVDINALQNLGDFSASSTDIGVGNGVGLVNNGAYLYASFSTSNTLATFAVMPGCALNFLGDVSPIGKHLGNVKGMAVHGNMLVLAYGDGSIESFDASAGLPVSNGDLQNAAGYNTDRYPSGVDITQDGHYAVFGDMATTATVEVSDVSSGKLTKTVLYNVGTAGNSDSLFLSPDQTMLYVANTGTGQVSAAFFNASTGQVTPGCASATLKGFDNNWTFLSSPVTELNSGTGSILYVAEFGASSGIAVVNVTSSAGKCTLTEAAGSPVFDPNSTTLLSIGVYPPRQF